MNTRYVSALLAALLGASVASCSSVPNLALPGSQQQGGSSMAHVPQALPNRPANTTQSGMNYQTASYTPQNTQNYSYANYGNTGTSSGSYYDNYDSYSNQNNAQSSGSGSYYDTTTGSSYDYVGNNNTLGAALPGGAYAVQILATISSAKANDLRRQMENMGYPAVVDYVGGLHKVRVPYQSKAQAQANLASIRAAANESQAFVATR